MNLWQLGLLLLILSTHNLFRFQEEWMKEWRGGFQVENEEAFRTLLRHAFPMRFLFPHFWVREDRYASRYIQVNRDPDGFLTATLNSLVWAVSLVLIGLSFF